MSSLSTMDSLAYHGKVWTDGRGFATARLPAEAGPFELEYELQGRSPGGSAAAHPAVDTRRSE